MIFLISVQNFAQTIEFSKAENVEIPKVKSKFNLSLVDFIEIRLYHSIKNGGVKHINPKISDITNDSLLKDLNQLLSVINSSKLDSNFVFGMPKYDSANEIKVLFLTSIRNDQKVEFEIFLQDDDVAKLTIREYYVINGCNYYVFNDKKMEEIKNSIIALIENYTFYDKNINSWEDPSKKLNTTTIIKIYEGDEN